MKKSLLFAIVSATILLTTSCYKDPDPGTGVVIVLDANSFRVPLADVTLAQPGQIGNGPILVQGLTDLNGEFSYSHTDPESGLALEVILNIGVTKGAMTGQGVIRIKPGEVSEEEVTIY